MVDKRQCGQGLHWYCDTPRLMKNTVDTLVMTVMRVALAVLNTQDSQIRKCTVNATACLRKPGITVQQRLLVSPPHLVSHIVPLAIHNMIAIVMWCKSACQVSVAIAAATTLALRSRSRSRLPDAQKQVSQRSTIRQRHGSRKIVQGTHPKRKFSVEIEPKPSYLSGPFPL